MLRIFFTFTVLVFAGIDVCAAQQATGNRMTPELLWKLGRVGSVAASPDGVMVAWTVRDYELAENNGTTDLVVSALQGGQEQVLLRNWKSISDVQWTGEGKDRALWFTGLKEKQGDSSTNQVFRIDTETMVAETAVPEQVSTYEESPANLKVSPDGKRLAFTQDVKLDQTVNDLYADLPKADARIIDSLMYRHWDSWHDYKYSHLHVASVGDDGKAGAAADLMADQKLDCPVPPFGGSEQIAWAPDSTRIAYTTKLAKNPAESTDTSVWVADATSPSSAKNVTDGRPGYDNNPVWTLDGTRLGFHSMVRAGFEADRTRFLLVEPAAGNLTELTEGLDQNAHQTTFVPGKKAVLFSSEINGTEQIFELSGLNKIRQLTSGDFNWGLVSVSPDTKSAVVTRQSMARPDEIFVMDLESGEAKQVSHANDEIFSTIDMPTFVRREVAATDGKTIMCWVALPPGFDAASGEKWPLLLYCQGGPQSQIGQSFSFRWNFHLMAAEGYVVVAPNRRGLPGFGQAWNDQISGDWGGQAMQDYLSATDDISKEAWIDTGKRAAVGASFGGYSVYWLMGNHEGRFKAMIAHCGVFNLESMYGSTEELFFVNWDLGGPYWLSDDTARRYEKFSPNKFVRNWKTPLLVIHSEKDFRVPVTQGMEAFTAAQVQRVPSRFLYFPDESHWVNQPQNSVLWQRVFYDWLDKHCKGKGTENE